MTGSLHPQSSAKGAGKRETGDEPIGFRHRPKRSIIGLLRFPVRGNWSVRETGGPPGRQGHDGHAVDERSGLWVASVVPRTRGQFVVGVL